ncbi:alpha/beta hydrolase [Haliea sp. E17]|uniref:alpha/beta hydrolase n=1 Tax=Haliea sp. E17 TaxID=3401576 RepID=UPI003AB05A1F
MLDLLGGCTTTQPEVTSPAALAPVNARVFDPLAYVASELRPAADALLLERTDDQVLNDSSLVQLRAGVAAFAAEPLAFPEVREATVPGEGGAPDVRVYMIGTRPGASKPAILHFHGGGYVAGSALAGMRSLQELALRHDCVVVSVDYRLAPETPFPGALEDNYSALRWLHRNAAELGVNPDLIMLMGESSGGGHAAMLAIAARDRGELPVHKQILVYPMLDDRTGSAVPVPPWVGRYLWNAESNRFAWSALLGVPAGSEVVPAGAVPARVSDLRELPPTFIAVGSVDLFADENIAFARRLVAAGIPTELLVVPGAFHGFDVVAPETALAAQFRQAIDRAISSALPARSAPGASRPLEPAGEVVEDVDLIPSDEGVISF